MARLNPSAVLVLIILFLVLFNPSSAPPSKAEQQHARAVVSSQRHKLEVLHNSTFGDFKPANEGGSWLALPGFEEAHGFKWHLLEPVQERAWEQATHAAGLDWEDVYQGISNHSLLMYQNISGVAKGRWVRSDISEDLDPSSVNLTAILPPEVEYVSPAWRRNITGAEGRMVLHIDDKSTFGNDDEDNKKNEDGTPQLREISGRVTLQDETSHADGWVAAVYGLHHVPSGAILLTTTSEKFAGIFAAPHLALSENLFNASKSNIYQFVNKTINRQEAEHDDTDNPWTSNVINPEEDPFSPMCELIIYAQQGSISANALGTPAGFSGEDHSILRLIEDELRFPKGKTLPQPPPLSISATVFSPDCGFVLESNGPPQYAPQARGGLHLRGLRYETRVRKTENILTLFALLLAAQLYLLILEIKQASTPARRGRISTITISMLSLGTGTTAFGFLFLSGIITSLFVPALVIAFLGFMDGLFFAMKFLMDIWAAQEPERLERDRRRERERAAARQTQATESSAIPQPGANNEGLPLPVTSARPLDTGATPVIIPLDQDTTQENDANTTTARATTFGAVYTRYCLLLLTIVFVSIWVTSSAALWFRTAYTNTLFFIYFSFWVPQIYRNIVRNGRKALTPRFVLGQTLLRPLPIAYFYAVTNNVLFVETDITTLLLFASWLWIQVVLLAGQEILGPRFLVSTKWSWVPAAWDYHPVLREDDEGAMMPVGYFDATAAASSAQTALPTRNSNDEAGPSTLGSGSARKSGPPGKGMRVFDCAICMQEIEAPVVPAHAFQLAAPSTSASASASSAIASGAPAFLARREYMVTPCRHIFHSACLEHWIGYRLQCPICRETLPPL